MWVWLVNGRVEGRNKISVTGAREKAKLPAVQLVGETFAVLDIDISEDDLCTANEVVRDKELRSRVGQHNVCYSACNVYTLQSGSLLVTGERHSPRGRLTPCRPDAQLEPCQSLSCRVRKRRENKVSNCIDFLDECSHCVQLGSRGLTE